LTWVNGNKYYGYFEKGDTSGYGHYITADKSYHAMFAHDKKNGHGQVHYKDGRKFIGTFVNGKQDGIGCVISKEGIKKYGLWKEGKKVKSEKVIGSGDMSYPGVEFESRLRKILEHFEIEEEYTFEF